MQIFYLVQSLCFLSMVQGRNKPACRHKDRKGWCSDIGDSIPVNKCYRSFRHCCDTCSRLMSNQPDCPFGDRATRECSEIGMERPLLECYTKNKRCCRTCHLLKLNITGCPFGDKVSSCDRIGTVYAVSSCYEREMECCQTCHRLKNNIPECQYGDRQAWCNLIGKQWPESVCKQPSVWSDCCGTCYRLGQGVVTKPHSTILPSTLKTTLFTPPKIIPTAVITKQTDITTGTTTRTDMISKPAGPKRFTTSPQNNMINIKTTPRSRHKTGNNDNNRPGRKRNDTSNTTQSSFKSTSPSAKMDPTVPSIFKVINTSISLPNMAEKQTPKPVATSGWSESNNTVNSTSHKKAQNGNTNIISISGNTTTRNPVYHVKRNYTNNKIENEILKRAPGKKGYSSWNRNGCPSLQFPTWTTLLLYVIVIFNEIQS